MSNYVSPHAKVIHIDELNVICQSVTLSGNAGEFEEQVW